MSISLAQFLVLCSEAGISANGGTPGSGTVTQVNTGNGLTGGPITTAGTIAIAVAVASGIMVSSAGSVASFSTTLPAGLTIPGYLPTPTSLGTNRLVVGNSTTTMLGLVTPNSSILGSSNSGVPTWLTTLPTGLTIPGYAKSSTFAGNPNGNVAGSLGDFVIDTTDSNELWYCTTAGVATAAVWTLATATSIPTPVPLADGGLGTSITTPPTGGIFFVNGAGTGSLVLGPTQPGYVLVSGLSGGSGTSTAPSWTSYALPGSVTVNQLLYASSTTQLSPLTLGPSLTIASGILSATAGGFSTGTGNPQGVLAGIVGDRYEDTTTNYFYNCITTGTATTAVWRLATGMFAGGTFGAFGGGMVAPTGNNLGSGTLMFAISGQGALSAQVTNSFLFGGVTQTGSTPTINKSFLFSMTGAAGITASGSTTSNVIFSPAVTVSGSQNFIFGNYGSSTINGNGNFVICDAASAGGNVPATSDNFYATFSQGYKFYLDSTTPKLPFSIDSLGNVTTAMGVALNGTSTQTPATGFSITLNTVNYLTRLTPAATLASGTIIFPTPTVNQRMRVTSTKAITALTLTPTGSDVILNAPTTLAAGGSFEFVYDVPTATWYAFQVATSASAGSGIVTINGDNGAVTGPTVVLSGTQAGASVTFVTNGSTTALSLSLIDNNQNIFLGGGASGIAGDSNTFLGTGTVGGITSGSGNSGLGTFALTSLTTGSNNNSWGYQSLLNLLTGSNNVAIGENSGGNYDAAESNNVLINSAGTTGENNTLRISATGTGAQQVNQAFIGGINGVSLTGTQSLVTSIVGDQLGTLGIGSGLSVSGGNLTASGGTTPNTQIQVTAATTSALTGTYNNGSAGVGATFTLTATGVQTFDTETVLVNNLYLIKNQASTFQNGIYLCTTAGATGVAAVFTRATNYNTSALMYSNIFIKVLSGQALGGASLTLLTPSTFAGVITIGTSALNYANTAALPILTSPSGAALLLDSYVATQGLTSTVSSGVSGLLVSSGTAFTVNPLIPANIGFTWTLQNTSITASMNQHIIVGATGLSIKLPTIVSTGNTFDIISGLYSYTITTNTGQSIINGATTGTTSIVTGTVGQAFSFVATSSTAWTLVAQEGGGFTLT